MTAIWKLRLLVENLDLLRPCRGVSIQIFCLCNLLNPAPYDYKQCRRQGEKWKIKYYLARFQIYLSFKDRTSKLLLHQHKNWPEISKWGIQVGILWWNRYEQHKGKINQRPSKLAKWEAVQAKIWSNKLITYHNTSIISPLFFISLTGFQHLPLHQHLQWVKLCKILVFFSNGITSIQFSQWVLLRHKQAKSSANFGKFLCFKLQICSLAGLATFVENPEIGHGKSQKPEKTIYNFDEINVSKWRAKKKKSSSPSECSTGAYKLRISGNQF